MNGTLFVACLLSIGAVVQSAAQSSRDGQPPPLIIDSISGEDSFNFYCATCHGRDARGAGPVATALKTQPADLTALDAAQPWDVSESRGHLVRDRDRATPAVTRPWRHARLGTHLSGAGDLRSSREGPDREHRRLHRIASDPIATRSIMSRPSIHVEPRGAVAIARHYIRDLVYGANDGIITTFAVVAGVAGGALSHVRGVDRRRRQSRRRWPVDGGREFSGHPRERERPRGGASAGRGIPSLAARRRDIRGICRRRLGAADALCDTGVQWAGIRLVGRVRR